MRVHLDYFLLLWCSHDLDDLDQLVDLRVPQERRLSVDHFYQNAPCRPDIDLTRVVSSSEDQLRRPIAPGTNVRQVWLT